jgi:hypothetical protein
VPQRVQYQPVTGPVWRAPVAESLSWLPTGAPLPRALAGPPRICFWVLEPIFQPQVYNPAGLQWLLEGQPRARDPERRDAYTVLPPRQYDPAGLQWLLMGQPRLADAPPRRGAIVLDPLPRFVVVYDPAGMQWVLAGQPIPRAAARGQGWTLLDPFPLPAAPPGGGTDPMDRLWQDSAPQWTNFLR